MVNVNSPFSTAMLSILFMSLWYALPNLPFAFGVPTPFSSTHHARGVGPPPALMSQRPSKSESAVNASATSRSDNDNTGA